MKKQTQWIVVAVVVAIVLFYAGMKFGESQTAFVPGGAQNGQFGRRGMGNGGRGSDLLRKSGGGFISGSILSKDDKSITVGLTSGGSKIIYFSDATTVGKMDAGKSSDLVVGQQVSVNGTTAADGTVAAQSIQIRPTMANSVTTSTPKQ